MREQSANILAGLPGGGVDIASVRGPEEEFRTSVIQEAVPLGEATRTNLLDINEAIDRIMEKTGVNSSHITKMFIQP